MVVGAVVAFHMRVYQCSFSVGLDGGYSKVVRWNFTSLNVKRIFVYKNRGHVTITTDNETGIRVKVVHHARTFDAMNKIESRFHHESGLVSVLANWEAELDAGFSCPQADVFIWIPLEIADGVLKQKVVWDPEALGPGRGAYLEPEPVPFVNRPDIQVVINGTNEDSWMLPRRGRIHVELTHGLAFRNMSLESNMGDITAATYLGDRVSLRTIGSSINASSLRAVNVDAHSRASEFYPTVGDVWPWVILAMWPVRYRNVGSVFMENVTQCGGPCSGRRESRSITAVSAAPVLSGSKFTWLDKRPNWRVTAYYEFAGHVGANALENDGLYWNGMHANSSVLFCAVWSGLNDLNCFRSIFRGTNVACLRLRRCVHGGRASF